MRPIDADAITYTMLYKENWLKGAGKEAQGVWKETIDAQPTVEAEPKWIPCTADLPSDAEEVIVTWVNRDPAPYYAHVKDVPYTGFAVYYNGNWYWWTSVSKDLLEEYGDRLDLLDKVDDAIEITAWMPLPKPYERKEE